MTVCSTIRRIRQTLCGLQQTSLLLAGYSMAAPLFFVGMAPAQQVMRGQAASSQQTTPAQRLGPLTLTESDLPDGFVGLPFHTSVAAVGGSGFYSIVAGGELPQGVTLVRGGGTLALSGVPTVAGNFQLRVGVTDMQGGSSASRTYSFHIGPSLANAQTMTATIADAEGFHFTDVDSVFFPAKIADVESFKFNDAEAVFKPAMIADAEAFKFTDTVSIFGPDKPMDADVFHFSDAAVVRLSAMTSDVEAFKFTDAISVLTKVGISPTTAPAGTYNVAYSQAFTVVGATATPSMTANAAALPTGMSFNCGTGCTLSGTPKQTGTFPFTLTAKDTSGVTVKSSSTVSYSLVINGTSQTINFPQPTPGVVGTSATLVASATSGLPVSFSIVSGPATLSPTNNSTITYTGAGTVIIAANQAGNATYAPAPTVQDSVVSSVVNAIWLVNGDGSVTKASETGTVINTVGTGGGASLRGGIALDSSSNAWSVSSGNNQLLEVSNAVSSFTSYTTGGLNGPSAVAIDGVGSVWIANTAGNSILEYTSGGAPISPTNGYTGVTPMVVGYSAPAGIAIDISGNVWVTNSSANTLTEILGGAAPASPLSTAVTNNTTGTRP